MQMLIGRDGKVKKAFIAKTDDEVLNEASIAVAVRWQSG
jgi:hypothetical protein